MSKYKLFGISEAFNHALEWRSHGADSMIKRNVSPALRATETKDNLVAEFYELEDIASNK